MLVRSVAQLVVVALPPCPKRAIPKYGCGGTARMKDALYLFHYFLWSVVTTGRSNSVAKFIEGALSPSPEVSVCGNSRENGVSHANRPDFIVRLGRRTIWLRVCDTGRLTCVCICWMDASCKEKKKQEEKPHWVAGLFAHTLCHRVPLCQLIGRAERRWCRLRGSSDAPPADALVVPARCHEHVALGGVGREVVRARHGVGVVLAVDGLGLSVV